MSIKTSVPLFAFVALATGCASITSDKTQSLAVTTQTKSGDHVEKATCSLKNDKGIWEVVTPGVAVVRRSAEDIIVECKKDGEPDGLARGISRAAGGMWGNIVFGGGIGALIDHNNGSGYNYPDDIPVKMGESVSLDRSNQKNNNQNQKAATINPEKANDSKELAKSNY